MNVTPGSTQNEEFKLIFLVLLLLVFLFVVCPSLNMDITINFVYLNKQAFIRKFISEPNKKPRPAWGRPRRLATFSACRRVCWRGPLPQRAGRKVPEQGAEP